MELRGLYAIADTGCLQQTDIASAVEQALRGGARLVQYRDKTTAADTRRRQADALRALCARYGAAFIVNDDVQLARAVGADGVHLGREDMALEAARALLGRHALIGISCYNEMERAERAAQAGADYVAFGSFFASPIKPQAQRADAALLHAAKDRLRVPLVAIGGITPENAAALLRAGADALAVITGVFAQADVEAAARRYAALFAES